MEDSLNRLCMDRIDIVYVHDPDENLDLALKGAFPALDELRRAAVIRSYGAGSNQLLPLVRVIDETDSDVILSARNYTLINHAAAEDLLPAAHKRGVAVVAAGVLYPDVLPHENPSNTPLPHACPRNIERVCNQLGLFPTAVALQFAANHPTVTTVCVGMRSKREVEEDVSHFEYPISKEAWRHLLGAILASSD